MWAEVVKRKTEPGKGLLPSSLLPTLTSGVAKPSVYPAGGRPEKELKVLWLMAERTAGGTGILVLLVAWPTS